MIIHNKFVGGNIFVDRIEGDHVYLRNELRDTTTEWFYWAFCVEGAEGQELTFHLGPKRLGYFGPAVSHNLEDWHWLDTCDGEAFTYKFGENESKVYFAHHMLYHPVQFSTFAMRNGLTVTEFCKSRKGNSVPCIKLGEGESSIILTARHHACESVGGYVLEGLVEELVKNPIENTRVLCVPFMDYDGVVDGDQGKNRYPHDYNRDYIDEPIYPEIRALIAYADEYGANLCFDFHSPSHQGKAHDHIYMMRCFKAEKIDRFSELLTEEYIEGGMHYSPQWDHPAKPYAPDAPHLTFNAHMNYRPENVLAFTMECTYAGLEENKVSQERLRVFGRSFANALRRFVKENN